MLFLMFILYFWSIIIIMIYEQKYNKNLEKVLDKIENNLEYELHIEELCSLCGYSPFHFQRLFKSYTGLSIGSYILKKRLEKGAFLLKYQQDKITNIALKIGFNNNCTFTRAFKNYFKTSPSDFKEHYKKIKQYEIPDFEIVHVKSFKVFFIRTFGDYKISEPKAWEVLDDEFKSILDFDTHFISICYDEPTICQNCNFMKYEACVLYEENKHKNIKNLPTKTINGGKFAKFEFSGNLNELDGFFYQIYKSFFKDKNHDISTRASIQIHHKNYNDLLFGQTKTDILVALD